MAMYNMLIPYCFINSNMHRQSLTPKSKKYMTLIQLDKKLNTKKFYYRYIIN